MISVEEVTANRDAVMLQVEENAGPAFSEQAADYVVEYLARYGVTSGENLTWACKDAGIIPHTDRAFGPVYARLIRQGLIRKVGTCARLRGNLTAGGSLYDLA